MKQYIDRVVIKVDDIIFLPKLKKKHSEDLWHVSDDPENGRLIIAVYEIDKMYLERVTDALATDDIYRWCYVDDLL